MSWTKKLHGIVLVFTSILISLLLAEFIVHFFFPQNLSGSWTIEHASGLLLNKTEGMSRHQYNEKLVSYRFGEYHNRKTERQDNLQKEIPKILVLGDSFTFGWMLPDGKTYVDRLQEHYLNEYEIINVAVGGWGTSDYAKYIEIFCNKVKPKKIFIYMNFGDINRSVLSSLYTLNDEGQIEIGQGHKKNKIKKILNNHHHLYQLLLENSHLLQLVRKAFLRYSYIGGAREYKPFISGLTPSKDIDRWMMLGKKLFLKIKNDSEKCGAELKVFNIAWEDIVVEPELDSLTMYFLSETKQERFFSMSDITFFDFRNTQPMEEVIANKERFSFSKDLHLNELGAERIFLATLESLGSQQ